MANTLTLAPGSRLRTGGTTYEVLEGASVPAGIVPVVPQASRLLKVFCETCGYTARITQRWITKAGTPECPSGHGHMVVAEKAAKVVADEVEPPSPPVKAVKARKAAPKAQPEPEPEPVSVEEYLSDPEPEPEPVAPAAATSPAPSTLEQLLAAL